jgi:hypothetical protein
MPSLDSSVSTTGRAARGTAVTSDNNACAGSGALPLRCNPPARHASCGARVAPSAPGSATLER